MRQFVVVFVRTRCIFSEHTTDNHSYCFPFPRAMCFMLKNMCLETKPLGSGSTTVISSSTLLWSALGGKWQEVCCVRELVGYYFLCVCTYVQPQYCTSLFHLHTRHCAVSDMGLDYLWGYNGPVRVAEINEDCFCGWEALRALLHCCTCSPKLHKAVLHTAWP